MPLVINSRHHSKNDVEIILINNLYGYSVEDPTKRENNLSILAEFWDFLKIRKKWWLAPILLLLLMMSLLIIITEGSAVAPFIYTLF